MAAQLNSVSIIPHLATTESIAAALLYDSILSAHLEELARARVERSADTVDFAQLLSVEQPRFKLQAIAQAVKPTPANEVQKEKTKLKKEQDAEGPSNKPPGWLPKKEYLAKVAAEKAANERIALAADRGRKPQPSRRRSRSRSQKKKSPRRERSPVREAMKRQRRRN